MLPVKIARNHAATVVAPSEGGRESGEKAQAGWEDE